MSDISFYCEHGVIRSDCNTCHTTVKSAVLSDDRKYRYVLRRTWDTQKPAVMFIGLNPSTADESNDDPTIRRCVAFAKSWGFGSMVMVNLFAYRITDPLWLFNNDDDPVGPCNDNFIKNESRKAGLVIAAWGNGRLIAKSNYRMRPIYVRSIIDNLCYLHMNNDGTPGHPLYLKGELTPVIWSD